ncbi:MAG: Uma2 family endonuclease [Thermoguttaceae bacterium]|jgi:hypothetical protein
MSISTPSRGFQTTQPAAVPNDLVWRLSVDQYHEMIRAGILTDGDPVELLDGWLVPRMVENPPHCIATETMRRALERVLPEGWHVNSQEPVTLAASEPEPDVMVVRGTLRDYGDRHPGPQDVALVVEVADASLERDRTTKKRLYAEAAIPVYWIVNLLDDRLEVYEDPSGPAEQPDYRRRRDLGPSDQVSLAVGKEPVAALPVRELLP